MIIGNGQLARAFSKLVDNDEAIIFASGVSDSTETSLDAFAREARLLQSVVLENSDKVIVYFSSCSLVDKQDAVFSPYYCHKLKMEELIRKVTKQYYIFRLPQLFGDLKRHPTLINYLYYKIIDGDIFFIYDEGYRYVIHLDDVVKIVTTYLSNRPPGVIFDIANPYEYSVLEIVKCLEKKAKTKGRYNLVRKIDQYKLNLKPLLDFVSDKEIDIPFGKDYFCNRLLGCVTQPTRQGDIVHRVAELSDLA